jgi:multidrug efflux pump subunit AcrB
VIYLVLAAQFESWVHPFTVMLAVPLAAVGALGLLWMLAGVNQLGSMFFAMANWMPDPPAWAGWLSAVFPRIPAMNINLFSLIGLVVLVGLVTKTSILLVEFANQLMAQGKSARVAMLESGRIRFRPILMTSFSMILGIMPIALGFGAGAESRRPMGVVVVGGMLTSTFLSLIIIPVIYTALDDLSQALRKRKLPSEDEAQAKDSAQTEVREKDVLVSIEALAGSDEHAL